MIGTPEQFAAWLVGRPAVIRELGAAYPATTCYRMHNNRGHYAIASYAEDRTVTLAHGRDSYLPGVGVFGISVNEIRRCDCGRWEPPTQDQVDASRVRLEVEHMLLPRCKDPNCVFHRGRDGGKA